MSPKQVLLEALPDPSNALRACDSKACDSKAGKKCPSSGVPKRAGEENG